MIKVSVMYPNSEGATFDIEYYCSKHFPMVEELLGDVLEGGSVDFGISGGAPGEVAPFLAVGHLTFESVEVFQGVYGPSAQKILSDIPNYTNSQPLIQISEIKVSCR